MPEARSLLPMLVPAGLLAACADVKTGPPASPAAEQRRHIVVRGRDPGAGQPERGCHDPRSLNGLGRPVIHLYLIRRLSMSMDRETDGWQCTVSEAWVG